MRSLVAIAAAALLSSCGECVFEQQVQGTVVDQDGVPIPGAELRTCTGEDCIASQLDKPCTQAISDAQGAFSLEVPMCRPVGGQCELRPILVTAADCLDAQIQTALDPGLLDIELVCER